MQVGCGFLDLTGTNTVNANPTASGYMMLQEQS